MKTKQPEDDNVFTTHDLGLSAALLASGYKLKNLDRTNRRALFVFEYKSGNYLFWTRWNNELQQFKPIPGQ